MEVLTGRWKGGRWWKTRQGGRVPGHCCREG